MGYTFSFSKANGEAGILLAIMGFAADYLITFTGFEWVGFVRAVGAAILAGGAAFGYTGITTNPVPPG